MKTAMNKKMKKRLIVFTDLDGTLLNHSDYSWEAARPALERIRELGIPLVICTSKTRPEVELIRQDMGLTGPFIVENGGGIFFPLEFEELPVGAAVIMDTYRCLPLGVPYARIRSFLEEAMKDFSIRGFGDMTEEEVSQLTGLANEQAALAKVREFTEPFVMENEADLPALERTAHLKGLIITRGGRFFHCMGLGNDKGEAVRRVTETFSRHWQEGVLSMGFGDSPNDFPLLKAVDIPVLIPHEDGTFEDLDLPGLVRAPYHGCRGWNEAALGVISDILAKKSRARGKKGAQKT